MQLNFAQFEPCFLLAAPELQDEHFQQRVVLLLEYQPDDGAFGLMLNHPLSTSLGEVLESEVSITDEFLQQQLWLGGPVATDTVFCMYEYQQEPIAEDKIIHDGLALAPAQALCEIPQERAQFPGAYRLYAGHAGWSPQQLDQEIQSGAWLLAPYDGQAIFNAADSTLWEQQLAQLGITPTNYQQQGPGDTMH